LGQHEVVMVLIEDGVADRFLDGHAMPARQPAQALLHPLGSAQQSGARGVLPQELELSADERLQLHRMVVAEALFGDGPVRRGARSALRYDHLTPPCIPRSCAASPTAPAAPADPPEWPLPACARWRPPGSRW